MPWLEQCGGIKTCSSTCQHLRVWVWSCQVKSSVYWIVPRVILSCFGNVGFGSCPKSFHLPGPLLFLGFFPSLFHGVVSTTWRGTGILNGEHWLEKLFPADTSIFYLLGWKLPGLLLPSVCWGLVKCEPLQDVSVYVEKYLVQLCPARGAGSALRPGSIIRALV